MELMKCDFWQVYGLTETNGAITFLFPEDHDIERGKSKVPNIHPLILEYLENRFRDWFIKKYKSLGDDMNVESIILEGINHFYTGQTRQEVKFVKPK